MGGICWWARCCAVFPEVSRMSPDQAVALCRESLQLAFKLGAPLLLAATLVSLAINVVQVLTSLQETTIATVPRLATVAAAAFVLMPWMIRQLEHFTLHLFSDFR